MRPGDRWVSAETDGKGDVLRVEVTVLDATYTVAAGIEARVVHDLVTHDGAVVEDTLDWYAQDADGNIWYLGEQTAEYENGQVASTEGSWEAGVDGAQPGIAVPADPRPGLTYRQEYLTGEAEDQGAVLSTDEQVQVPTGIYTGALLTRDTTALEPDLVELKFYVPGIGPVLTLESSGGAGREELVETEPLTGSAQRGGDAAAHRAAVEQQHLGQVVGVGLPGPGAARDLAGRRELVVPAAGGGVGEQPPRRGPASGGELPVARSRR